MFVSDPLEMCEVVTGLLVDRASEWAYIKTAQGANSAVHAIVSLGRLHFGWITDSGGFFGNGLYVDTGERRCEISPLVSYSGEDLNGLFGIGEMLELPCYIQSSMEKADTSLHGTINKRHSLHYVDPQSLIEHMEEDRVKGGVFLSQERARDTPGVDQAIAQLCSRRDSELPSTPSSLRSEVDNWQAKVEQMKEDMALLKQQKGALHNSTLTALVTERKGAKTKIVEDEQLTMVARREHGDSTAEEKDVDPFEEAMRDPPKRETPMPHLRVLSNIWSRVPNGGQRRFVYSHSSAPSGGHTLFGQDGGYKPSKSHIANAEHIDRHKQWRNVNAADSQRLMQGSELPQGQRHYQWTTRPPKASEKLPNYDNL